MSWNGVFQVGNDAFRLHSSSRIEIKFVDFTLSGPFLVTVQTLHYYFCALLPPTHPPHPSQSFNPRLWQHISKDGNVLKQCFKTRVFKHVFLVFLNENMFLIQRGGRSVGPGGPRRKIFEPIFWEIWFFLLRKKGVFFIWIHVFFHKNSNICVFFFNQPNARFVLYFRKS